jgi:hypothetical protein
MVYLFQITEPTSNWLKPEFVVHVFVQFRWACCDRRLFGEQRVAIHSDYRDMEATTGLTRMQVIRTITTKRVAISRRVSLGPAFIPHMTHQKPVLIYPLS